MADKFFEATATLVGTIVGAGVLGIPYVIAKSGLLIGLVYLLILGTAIVFVNLYIGEVCLRTKRIHQLTGYAEKYLGKKGKILMFIASMIAVYGALTAYLIGQGQTMSALFNIPPTYALLGFFFIMFLMIYKGINVIKCWELSLGILMLFILLLIMVFAIPSMNLSNLATIDLSFVFLPYGVILFSFIGAMAIPEMKEILKTKKEKLKKAIILGSIIPIITYTFFVIVSVAVTGLNTNQIATIGLGQIIGRHMVIMGNLFAILSMTTSFLALGLALKWTYQYDCRMNKDLALILALFVPLTIALLNITNFIEALGITGAIAGGIEGTLIVLMFHKSRKLSERKPEYKVKTNIVISSILVFMFICGIFYTIFQLLA